MRKEFKFHKLNDQGMGRSQKIAEAFDALANTIEEYVPVGRERSIVTTKLEEACFFAKKGMAQELANQAE